MQYTCDGPKVYQPPRFDVLFVLVGLKQARFCPRSNYICILPASFVSDKALYLGFEGDKELIVLFV